MSLDPPGPGVWWLMLEHAPRPVRRLGEALLRTLVPGWSRGARRLGLPAAAADFRGAGRWLSYSPGLDAPVVDDELGALEALATGQVVEVDAEAGVVRRLR